MELRFTHINFPVLDIEESLEFYRKWLHLEVQLDRRPKGDTVWLTTPEQHKLGIPDFVFVIYEGNISRKDHFGFQVDSREHLNALAEEAEEAGILVYGVTDLGADVGSFIQIRDPSGHIWEYTYGQDLKGL